MFNPYLFRSSSPSDSPKPSGVSVLPKRLLSQNLTVLLLHLCSLLIYSSLYRFQGSFAAVLAATVTIIAKTNVLVNGFLQLFLCLTRFPIFDHLPADFRLKQDVYKRQLSRHPFSRSYGVILPSSLTRVLSFVLGFSPRPPASVCGTGTPTIASAFSCQRGFTCFTTCFSLPITAPPYSARTSLRTSLTAWTGSTINRLMLSFCVNASLLKVVLESPPVVHRLRLLSSA